MTPDQAKPRGTQAATMAATLQLIGQRGLLGFSIEDVARLAGVHKTTLYRRWGNVEELSIDAVKSLVGGTVEVPDTGDVGDDLRLFARAIVELLSHPVYGPVIRSLLGASHASSRIMRLFHEFWNQRMFVIRPIVERAVDRGEFPPGTDPELVFQQLGAPLYYRLLVTDHPVGISDADLAAAATVAAARSGLFAPEAPLIWRTDA